VKARGCCLPKLFCSATAAGRAKPSQSSDRRLAVTAVAIITNLPASTTPRHSTSAAVPSPRHSLSYLEHPPPAHPEVRPARSANMPSATGSSWEKYQKNFADDEVEEKKITPLTDE
jgi:hypothetical protein